MDNNSGNGGNGGYHRKDKDLASKESPARRSTRVGREAPKYLLRLPPELRDFLQREANLNGRSVNSEIISRLEASRSAKGRRQMAEQPSADYIALSDQQRQLMQIFDRLSPEKQLALISLFK